MTRRAKIIVLLAIILLTAWISSSRAQEPELPILLFTSGQDCMAMIDFQSVRQKLEKMPPEERQNEIFSRTLDVFARKRQEKCPVDGHSRLLAVYITGLDNYGRPDFGNKVMVMEIKGKTGELLAAQKARVDGQPDWAGMKKNFAITLYDPLK